MTLWYFLTAIMYDFVYWLFVVFSVGSPLPTLSPVNGFFVVGVVIVFSPFSPFVRLLLYQVLILDQIHVFIKRNLFFFYDWIAINWTVFCYVIHWRCYNFSCIWIFDTWFTWNFFFATFRCVWIKFIL